MHTAGCSAVPLLLLPAYILLVRPTWCRRYGGVVYRENVALKSDWYVFTIDQITRALQQAAAAGSGSSAAAGNGAH